MGGHLLKELVLRQTLACLVSLFVSFLNITGVWSYNKNWLCANLWRMPEYKFLFLKKIRSFGCFSLSGCMETNKWHLQSCRPGLLLPPYTDLQAVCDTRSASSTQARAWKRCPRQPGPSVYVWWLPSKLAYVAAPHDACAFFFRRRRI